jgi:hypothetical protein
MSRMPPAVAAAILVLVLAGCGGSHTAAKLERSGAAPVTSEAAPVPPTTTVPPPPTPAELDQGACRAFVSFDEFVSGAGDPGSEAYGQVGGMVEQAQTAATAAPGQSGAATLLTDLQALSTLIASPQWAGTPAEASTPQVTAVAADCKAFPTP